MADAFWFAKTAVPEMVVAKISGSQGGRSQNGSSQKWSQPKLIAYGSSHKPIGCRRSKPKGRRRPFQVSFLDNR